MEQSEATIYTLVKFGKKEHLEDLRRTGSLFMPRLAYYRNAEDAARRDDEEALTAAYQPSKATLTIGGIASPIKGIVGPIKAQLDDDLAHHVFCMHALTSERLPMIIDNGHPPIDPANFDLGAHALVFTNCAEFIDRVRAAFGKLKIVGDRPKIALRAGLVEYVDPALHSGLLGPFKKRAIFARQVEWRIVFPPTDEDFFRFRIGRSLEDISLIVPAEEINSQLRFSVSPDEKAK